MQITMLGEYAIRTMMHLAARGEDTVVNIREVSEKWDIPEAFLRKIIPRLIRAGYINSNRGNSGGIFLIRPAATITPLDILESVEGEISLNRCVLFPGECKRSTLCSMHEIWQEARINLRRVLNSKSISDLVLENQKKADNRIHDRITETG